MYLEQGFAESILKVVLFTVRRSRPGVLLSKGVLKICSKFTGEHACGNAISIKLVALQLY